MGDLTREVELAMLGRGEDEGYFEETGERTTKTFDAQLLREPVTVLSTRSPLICSGDTTTSEAMRAMQAEHRGCVLITEDGTFNSPLTGIFTERDILLRVINRGRNPAETPLEDVMSRDPEFL